MTGKVRKVLLVDDEASFTRLVKLSLERTGSYEVRVVHEGLQAFACAREFKPDLILLDFVIPDMDGREVASQFAADEELKKIPIVFLTGFPLSKMKVERPFLCKPLTAEDIQNFVQEFLAENTFR